MAKHKRKQAPAKPVTTHQLFPAVVALWFGALFGLGSLAVRPSLLESLLISSRIDLIVPAAAPPLGITARILLALVLAAIGAAIGIAFARRLARPKQEHRERKRGAGSVIEDSDKLHGGRHYADATLRHPISVSEALGDDPSGNFAQRRRSLAIEHEEVDFVPHDMAPLPGGAPQILDIGEMQIGHETAEAPLDLSAFADPTAIEAAPAPAVPLDWSNAAPVQSAPGVEPQAPRQIFQPLDEDLAVEQASLVQHQQDLAQEAAAAAAAGRQVFGMAQPVQTEEPARQIFGQSFAGDHVDPEFIKSAGYKTSVFDVEESSPLFAPRSTVAAPATAPLDYAVPPAPEIQAYQVPEAYAQPSQLAASTEPTETPNFAPPIAAEAPQQPAPSLPSPTGLGMDDLASRLAESMARRRAARSGPPSEAAPVPIPTAFEPALLTANFATTAVVESVAVVPAMPAAYVPPISAEPLAPPPPFAAPAMPAFAPQFIAEASPEAETAPATATIPQAMRPLDLGGFEEDDAPLDSVLPPRLIAMPPVLAEAITAPEPAPAAFAAPVDEAEVANEDVAEESYGSLLAVTPPPAPRTGFVRIEEPEAETAATEPVVIFPGQMARPAASAAADDGGSFRRFDAPASAGQGQPIAANQAQSDVDSEEAQRALRSALANLQRMSGAA